LKKAKVLMSAALAAVLAAGMVLPAYADTKDEIAAAQSAQAQTQSSLNEAENQISSLQTKKGDLETYLNDLNTQLSSWRRI
jgi:septal ring factor EnvC (AmiA/AmiB activator)